MFCPKCGISVEEGVEVCTNCGLEFDTINQSETKINVVKTEGDTTKGKSSMATTNKSNPIIKFIYFGLGIVVFIMFFMAASKIVEGGLEMMQIKSVGGKTLDEAYYAELGVIYSGYAMVVRAMGITFASLLVWLGLKE